MLTTSFNAVSGVRVSVTLISTANTGPSCQQPLSNSKPFSPLTTLRPLPELSGAGCWTSSPSACVSVVVDLVRRLAVALGVWPDPAARVAARGIALCRTSPAAAESNSE